MKQARVRFLHINLKKGAINLKLTYVQFLKIENSRTKKGYKRQRINFSISGLRIRTCVDHNPPTLIHSPCKHETITNPFAIFSRTGTSPLQLKWIEN